LAGVLAVLFGVLTARAIARPVRAMQEAAERLATGTVADLARAMSALAIGDLNGAHAQVDLIPLDLHGRDEVGALATSFATMQGAIASIVISLDRAREGLRASRDMLVSRNEALVHEVTEREVTEAALRQSEERYRQMETHTPIGMSLQAPDGRYLRVNPALCALVGYSEEELLARTFLDITHPGDIDSGRGQLRGLLAGEISTYAAEKRYIHKGGAPVWVLLAVSLVRDEDGRPRYFISQVQDITERKLIEQALAQSKATAEELAHLRHQQAEEAEAMAAVGTALSSALDPGTVYRIILEQAARVLPFDHAAIALYRDGWVISVATLGGPDIAPETRLVPIDPSTSTWQMLTSGKPAHLADTEEVPGWTNPPPWRGTHRMRSMIVVPLLIDGALIGSFKVASFTPHFYTVTHIERAAAFGERATQAVRNARLYAAEKERTRIAEDLARLGQELVEEAEAMAAVSVALTSTLEPHVLYRVILEQVVRVLPCDLVNVKLFQEGWVTIVESWGDPASPTGTRIAPLDDTAAFWLPTLSTPCYLADTTQEPSWRDIPPHVDEYRVRSVITVPLVVDGVQLGAFDVCSMTPRFYSERHIRLAGAFGERVAQALHNARLYLAVRERSCAAEELARLRSDFVASVSHELRTPLTAIVGFSELLLARWEQFSEAQRMQRINHIVQAANRQQRLVEDLLLIGRIETASLAPKSEVLPL
ncbi:MAG TPA: PAS domain S-box protein, partial [Ktedonobacterales bacterium]|nr:PAS domain S-box protein [Ktedonobacterales bacterium]